MGYFFAMPLGYTPMAWSAHPIVAENFLNTGFPHDGVVQQFLKIESVIPGVHKQMQLRLGHTVAQAIADDFIQIGVCFIAAGRGRRSAPIIQPAIAVIAVPDMELGVVEAGHGAFAPAVDPHDVALPNGDIGFEFIGQAQLVQRRFQNFLGRGVEVNAEVGEQPDGQGGYCP